jgi:hypothetical protein
MTREPWRYTVAIWLLLLLLAPAYRWALVAALVLLAACTVGTLVAIRRAAITER